MKTIIITSLAALLASLVLVLTSGCTRDEQSNKKDRLGLVMVLKGHPVHQIIQLGFLEACRDLGYEGRILAADGADIAAAISLGEAGLAQGCKGLVVWAGSPAYYPFIKKCTDRKTPVVVPHFPIPEGDAPGVIAVCGCDPRAYAEAAADAIAQQVGQKGTVAVTQGDFNSVENLVAATFTSHIQKNYPNMKVLAPKEEGFDPPVAISKASALLQGNPDVVAAFSTTGGGPQTWYGASNQTGRKICAIGMDYTRVNLDLVDKGRIFAIVAQPLYREAHKAVELLDQNLKGQPVSYYNYLDAPLVTKGQTASYLELLNRVEATAKN